MAVQRRVVGSGITKREVLVFAGSPADVRDTLQAASASATFEAQITEADATASKILAAAGPDIASDTPAAYAQQIRRLIQIVRGAIGRNDAAEAARYALNLGALIREADLKFEWEKHALNGAQYSQRQSSSGKAKKGIKLPRDLNLLAAFEKKRKNRDQFNGGRSDTRLAEDAGRLFGIKKGGALKAIKRARAHLHRKCPPSAAK